VAAVIVLILAVVALVWYRKKKRETTPAGTTPAVGLPHPGGPDSPPVKEQYVPRWSPESPPSPDPLRDEVNRVLGTIPMDTNGQNPPTHGMGNVPYNNRA
jgi:hypothetical protein